MIQVHTIQFELKKWQFVGPPLLLGYFQRSSCLFRNLSLWPSTLVYYCPDPDPSITQGSNSRMEDRGHLDMVPDDESQWNLKYSFSMDFWTHQDNHLQLTSPSRIQLQDGGQGSSWRGSWWPILMKFETQLLHDVLDSPRLPTPTSLSIKDPTPGWRTGVILMGFLMTYLDEIWNIAFPYCSWLTKMTDSN